MKRGKEHGMKMLGEHLPQRHLRKFVFVWAGFKDSWATSSGFRLHLLADLLAFALGGILTISLTEWVWLVVFFALKTAVEPFNSAIELLVDEVFLGNVHDKAKRVKDFAAFGVFATLIGSFVVWGVVFVPKIYELFP